MTSPFRALIRLSEKASDLSELGNAAWIPLAGSISDATCQPIYGYLAKLKGTLRPMVLASALLSLGLLTCFASQSLWQLALGRVLFGMGSSGVLLLAIVMLTDLVPLANLPLWRSVVVVVQSLGFMSGGPLGSLLASETSWHIPFLVESLLASLATLILLLAMRSPVALDQVESQTSEPPTTPVTLVHNFDILGGILLLLTVLVPLVGLNLWGNVLPGTHPAEITFLCLTPMLLGLFTYHELYNNKSTLLPLHLFKNLQSVAILACTGLTIFARNQLDIHITFYAEVRSQPDNIFTNWILTCQFLGVSLGSVFSGWLIAKFRHFTWLLFASIISAFVLYLLMATGIIHPENARFAPALISNGVALGAIQNCLIVGLFVSTAMEDRSMSYAFFELTVSVFADIGIAVSSALQRQWFIGGMQETFGHSPETAELISKSLQSLDAVRKLPEEIRSRVLERFIIALRKVFGVSCGLLALATLVAVLLPNAPFGTWLPHPSHLRESEDED
ncbi:hypothetical protein EG329_002621 [Mollisiaceae sp. DMI_Dod_QoI]|nr:hypothetical protein EG329_002621 [Helotiales sp. DMI_Dod_QoI]